MNNVSDIQGVLDIPKFDIRIVKKKFSKTHSKLLSRSTGVNSREKTKSDIMKSDHKRS